MTPAADALAQTFAPITLDELNAAAALDRRIDTKYIVDAELLHAAAEQLDATHRALEIAGRRSFAYRSVYFDSASLATYRGHVQGRRNRFKVRSRLYVETADHQFEVKLKAARGETVKQRIRAEAGTFGQLTDEAREFFRSTVLDAYGEEIDETFQPALETSYRRVTLASPERGERLTCDFDLGYAALGGRTVGIAPGTVIVESKAAGGRSAADDVLRALGARPVAVSKYVLGVAVTRPELPANDARRLVRRCFGEHRPPLG